MTLKTIAIDNFTGGRNTKATSPTLAKNESLDQLNTWCENGALVKRRGWTSILSAVGTTSFTPLKMAITNLGTSGTDRIVMMGKVGTNGNLIYTDNGTSFAFCESTPTNLSATRLPWMGMFGAKLYVSDGVSTVVSYDGTNVASVAAFPKYAVCATHKSYVFAANASIVYWSALNDAETWPANNFQSVNSQDGNSIMGLAPWGGNLIIFKQKSMWALVGDVFDPTEGNYYLQKIDTPPGFNFFFKDTIVTHNGVMKFLTTDGFYAYSGGNTIVKISDAIQSDTDPLIYPSIAANGENNVRTPQSCVWKNAMYCSVFNSSRRQTFVQDRFDKWWSFIDDNANPNDTSPIGMLPVAFNGTAVSTLYGSNMTGILVTLDTGNNIQYFSGITTASVPLIGYWISKDFNLANETRFKYADIFLKKQTAVAGLGTLILSVSIDGATFIDFNIDMTSGVGTVLKKRIPIGRIGRSIRVKVYNAQLGVTFEVYQIVITHEPTDAMR